MHYYPKIPGVYYRNSNGEVQNGIYATKELELLKDIDWVMTEKIDGANTNIDWDGDKITFIGHTDKSIIQPNIMDFLEKRFHKCGVEEVFEQIFRDKPVRISGECYGPGIGPGNMYRSDIDFIAFDILNLETGKYFEWDSVKNIAKELNISTVPEIIITTLKNGVDMVKTHFKSKICVLPEGCYAEGLVARPVTTLYNNKGELIRCKIKWKDLKKFS